MDYKNLPADLVNKLRAEDVQVYAEATGWKRLEAFKKEIAVYRRLDSKLDEIVIPLDTEFADYNQRMTDAIVGLSEFENRSAKEVLDELLLPADTVCFCLEDSTIQNGAVTLESALNLINGGKKALFSIIPNDYIATSGISDDRVKYIMTSLHHFYNEIGTLCRFERSQESFTICFVYPLEKSRRSSLAYLQSRIAHVLGLFNSSDEVEPPLAARLDLRARFIIESLMRSTEAIVQAVAEDDLDRLLTLREEMNEIEDIDERHEGTESDLVISSQLCDALLDMQPRGEGGNLLLKSTWAKIEPNSSKTPNEVRIPQHLFAGIEVLSRELHLKDESKSSFYVGKIYEIGNANNGEVFLTLFDNSENGLFKARVELNPIDFEKATQAYREGYNIGILGRRQQDRPTNHIHDYKLFQVLVPITMGESSFSFRR